MDPLTQMALVQTGGQVGANMISNVGNRWSQARAFRYNQEAWMRANEYNSPVNQMARLKEAGINPHALAKMGDTGNTGQIPKYTAHEVQVNPVDLLGMLGQYQQIKTAKAQEENIYAETAVKMVDKVVKQMDADLKSMEVTAGVMSRDDIDRIPEKDREMYIRESRARTELIENQARLANQMVNRAETFNKYMDYSQISGVGGDIVEAVMRIAQIINMYR